MRGECPEAVLQAFLNPKNQLGLTEEGVENVYLEVLFRLVAREVAAFPDKQRQVILTDIAVRMHFGKRQTPLQQAFFEAGIASRGAELRIMEGALHEDRFVAAYYEKGERLVAVLGWNSLKQLLSYRQQLLAVQAPHEGAGPVVKSPRVSGVKVSNSHQALFIRERE